MKINYSHQAKKLIESLKDFNKDSFEEWFVKKNLVVGGSDVVEFALLRGEE